MDAGAVKKGHVRLSSTFQLLSPPLLSFSTPYPIPLPHLRQLRCYTMRQKLLVLATAPRCGCVSTCCYARAVRHVHVCKHKYTIFTYKLTQILALRSGRWMPKRFSQFWCFRQYTPISSASTGLCATVMRDPHLQCHHVEILHALASTYECHALILLRM